MTDEQALTATEKAINMAYNKGRQSVINKLPHATSIWLKASELRPDQFMNWFYESTGISPEGKKRKPLPPKTRTIKIK